MRFYNKINGTFTSIAEKYKTGCDCVDDQNGEAPIRVDSGFKNSDDTQFEKVLDKRVPNQDSSMTLKLTSRYNEIRNINEEQRVLTHKELQRKTDGNISLK